MFTFASLFAPKVPKPILLVSTNKEPKDLYKWVKQQLSWRSLRAEYHILFIMNPRLRVIKFEIIEVKQNREIDSAELLLPFMGVMEDIIKTMPITEPKKSKKTKAKAK